MATQCPCISSTRLSDKKTQSGYPVRRVRGALGRVGDAFRPNSKPTFLGKVLITTSHPRGGVEAVHVEVAMPGDASLRQ